MIKIVRIRVGSGPNKCSEAGFDVHKREDGHK